MYYNYTIFNSMSRDSSVSIVTRLRAGRAGFALCATKSRSALGPNQVLIQRVPGFFPGGKAAGARNWPLTSI